MGLFAPLLFLMVGAQTPTGDRVDWNWDRDTQTCALREQTSSTGATIEVSRTPANDQTAIMITVPSDSNLKRKHFSDGVIKLDSDHEIIAEVNTYFDDENRFHVLAITQDPSFLEKFSNADTLDVSHGDVDVARIGLRSPAAAVAALRSCEDKKMRAWGIDPVAWRALRSRPVPLESLTRRFSDLDYPMNALTFLVTGDAVTRLDVAPNGSVRQCRSLNASEYKGFEDATCRVLKGARFKPALDSTGVAVTAPYVIDVVFRIGR